MLFLNSPDILCGMNIYSIVEAIGIPAQKALTMTKFRRNHLQSRGKNARMSISFARGSLSSRGLGHRAFNAATRVRIPLGTPHLVRPSNPLVLKFTVGYNFFLRDSDATKIKGTNSGFNGSWFFGSRRERKSSQFCAPEGFQARDNFWKTWR
jgi:hypothetical protein